MTCQNSNLLCYLYLYLFCYWLLFCYPSADNLVPDQHLISCTCEHVVTFDWSGYRASSSWYFAKPSCSIIWSKLYYQIEGQVPYNDFRSGCPKKMTLLKDHFVILAALRSHGQTVQTALLSRFVGQYARRLSTHKISCFIGLPGALPWLPFTIRPFCMDVSNMSTGTWTCGGMWSSAVSPDFGYGSGIFDSQHGLSDRFADCCTDMVTAFVGGRDGVGCHCSWSRDIEIRFCNQCQPYLHSLQTLSFNMTTFTPTDWGSSVTTSRIWECRGWTGLPAN